ncbi:MAG: polymorphic toxin-type HINT domain-containing protein, partial [Ktedonobacteraceae bacterium]
THAPHSIVSTATSEVIHTNKKHPFFTEEKGFLPVAQLKLGMHVLRADGRYGEITGYRVVPGSAVMYNLEVEQDHTFVVGAGEWVVHNDCGQVRSLIHDDPGLVREAERMGNNQAVQREADDLMQRFLGGNTNPGLGSKNLFGDISYLRGRNGARVFYRMADDTMEILGKADKNNEQKVINILQRIYGGP